MKNSLVMRRAQGSSDLLDHLAGAIEWHSFRLNLGTQRNAIDVLHHDIRFAVGQLTSIENAHHSGMIDAR